MIKLKDLSLFIRNSQRTKITVVAFVLSIFLLVTLFKFSDIDVFVGSIKNLNITFLLISFLFFLSSIIVITFRLLFVLHLSPIKKLIPSLDVSIVHTFLLCVLPARLGDICYPFLLNKNLNIIISHSFVNLLVLRLYDFMAAALLFFFSTVMLTINFEEKLVLQKAALLFFMISVCLLLFMKYLSSHYSIEKGYRGKSARLKKIVDIFIQLQNGFRDINMGDHFILFIMTLIRWCLSIGVIFYIFQSLNLDIQFTETVLVTTGMNLVVALPIQSIGGFGITEAAMAFLLGLVGYGVNDAISYSLATRAVWIILPLSIGLIWLLLRSTVLKKNDYA
jgi:uncharacterized protein (TIRG00374 family)